MDVICSRDLSIDSAAFQDDAMVHSQSWPEVVGGFKKTVMSNNLGRVPIEPSQVLIFACMGKGARFGYWLAHVHAC